MFIKLICSHCETVQKQGDPIFCNCFISSYKYIYVYFYTINFEDQNNFLVGLS